MLLALLLPVRGEAFPSGRRSGIPGNALVARTPNTALVVRIGQVILKWLIAATTTIEALATFESPGGVSPPQSPDRGAVRPALAE